MAPYRVFVSYAHGEKGYATKIIHSLQSSGMLPLWDKHIISGMPFRDEIERLIAYSHVFLPVISPGASTRGWVHQEIGYALALNIPVLPVTIKGFAGAMLQDLNVVEFTDDKDELKKRLSPIALGNLINLRADPALTPYRCATFPDDRARMFAAHADDLSKRGFYGMVRQKGGLSSFHIPDCPPGNWIWQERYGDVHVPRFHCAFLRKERLALEKHAKEEGCRLVIDPTQKYKKYGPRARLARLVELRDFLKEMPSDKVQVAIDSGMPQEESLTIVGDWFLAESVSSLTGEGYRQTIFTLHAPSILERVETFDRDFAVLLRLQKWEAESSRDLAIGVLEDIIKEVSAQLNAEANAAD